MVSDTFGVLNHFTLNTGGLSVRVLCNGGCPFERGDIVEVYGVIFEPYRFKNPGNFLEYKHTLFLKATKIKKVGFKTDFWYIIHRFRRKAVKGLLSTGTSSAKMACALVFGAREVMSPVEKRVFYNLGLGHILAVSGFHFGVILGVLYFVLLFTLRIINLFFQFPFHLLPTRCAHLLNIPFSFAFLILTGAQISAERAFVMYVIFVLLLLWEREAVLKKVAVFSFILLILLRPSNIKDLGFQLSFTAIFAIAFIWERIKDSGKLQKFLIVTLFTSASVSPVVAFYFHRFYPLSIVSNLLMLPIFTLLIPVLFVLSFLNLLIPKAWFLFYLLDFIWKPLFSFMQHLSNLKIATVWITRTETLMLVLLLCFAYLLIFRHRILVLSIAVVITLVSLSYFNGRRDKAVFFDLGRKGNATLIVCKNRRILIDAGGLSKRGEVSLLSSLLWLDSKVIDRVFVRGSSKVHSAYLPFLKKNLNILKTTVKKGHFDICGVRFAWSKEGCGNSSLCYIKNGLVLINGRRYLTWRNGALITSLEE